MGSDAHTASLFPDTDALGETERWFVDNWDRFDDTEIERLFIEVFAIFRRMMEPPTK